MNANTAFTDEQWNTLVQGVAEAYDDLTLKRGFQYERMGSVQQLSLSEDRRLEAEVKEGDTLCRVELALDLPAGGSCGCKDRKPCRHQAAALMKLARLRGRPVSALANASASGPAARTSRAGGPDAEKGPARDASLEGGSAAAQGGHAESGSPQAARMSARTGADGAGHAEGSRPDFLAAEEADGDGTRKAPGVEQAALLAASGISAWHRRFEEAAASLTGRTRNPKFAELTLSRIFEDLPPFGAGIEALYRLNAHLFVLKTMISSSTGYYAHLAVSDTAAGMEACLAAPLPEPGDPLVRERLDETLGFLRRLMLTEDREQDAFSRGYYRLLTEWAAPESGMPAGEHSDRYESELQYLMDGERELGRSLNRQAWLGANAWSRFCLGQDDRAKALLAEAADKPYFSPKKLPDFLSPAARSGQWERLAGWLETFGPLLERARANLDDYGRMWDETLEHLPDAEPRMWAALSGMLPYASTFYETKLLERERWDEWMDYQLSTGAEPSRFKVTELAPIEKNAPEQLLPFYHQAVERMVEQRSRDGYKAAVKLLKRLEKLYRKMKREERWDFFMESFNARYGRLRALQEELKKGKLML
ncbi:hypothetical protein [Saccharibacillus alkalitolerans]|uniref:SWIM-type domain-containing protein n=1 Tax=Saccharibacillus alkalitolerans TaxID=2705290 RepID=A0ABX0F8G1_9BACL|nr:hypothetical protein [Saccharibacillus alkalitolerans]NGZ77256.1 hypothetical protein [Saccharibacillus alkalitolerans]